MSSSARCALRSECWRMIVCDSLDLPLSADELRLDFLHRHAARAFLLQIRPQDSPSVANCRSPPSWALQLALPAGLPDRLVVMAILCTC